MYVCMCVSLLSVCACELLIDVRPAVAPRNILFDEHQNPVLADFGLSRRVRSSVDGSDRPLYQRTEGLGVPIRWYRFFSSSLLCLFLLFFRGYECFFIMRQAS
jgi:hypothetical protein